VVTSGGLFSTDGTDANTTLILPGVETVNEVIVSNNKAYFKGLNPTENKDRAYESDGTVAGTRILATVGDQNNYIGFNSKSELALLNDNLICRMSTPTQGSEIASVSLTGNAQVIKDIRPGIQHSLANSFTVFKEKVFFVANDGVNGFELWSTDGTANGTTMVKNASTGTGDGVTNTKLHALNGEVYFTGGNRQSQWIWKTTGTGTGAEEYYDLNGGASIAATTDTLYFLSGRKLIKSNGLTGGSKEIMDFQQVSFVDIPTSPNAHFFIGDKLIYNMFTAGGSLGYGSEYWVIDKLVAGTNVLKDIYPGLQDGVGSSNADEDPGRRSILLTPGTSVFAGKNGTNGRELWVTNGTGVGTTLVKDINPGSGSSEPQNMTATLNGYAYFTADDGVHGIELWKTDGTGVGTVLVKDVDAAAGSAVGNIVAMDNAIYFTAHVTSEGWGLYKTDGTASGTARVKLLNNQAKDQGPTAMIAIDHKIYISAFEATSGHELWASDGTGDGTLVIDIVEGANGSNPGLFYEFNNELYFAADNKLWHSKGSESLTEFISDIQPRSFLKSGTLLYMVATSPLYGTELFKMPAKEFCGFGEKPTIALTMPTPFQPLLTSSSAVNNVWYFNGNVIEGATQQTYAVTRAGTYTMKIVEGSCVSEESAAQVINKIAQTITFEIPARRFEDGDFKVIATSSAGLPLTYSTASEEISIEVDLVKVKSAGSASITATSAGNDLIAEAMFVRTFCINPTKPTVAVTGSGNQIVLTSSADVNNQWYLDTGAISGSVNKTLAPVISGSYTVEVNVENCKTMSDAAPVLVTGIEDIAADIAIFPNPATTSVHISWPTQRVEAEIVNSQGRSMEKLVFEGTYIVNVESYSTDVYFVKLKSDNQVIWKKFIKN
jgi:ELWxxDGT repeat protein